jgi:hypothetical protein
MDIVKIVNNDAIGIIYEFSVETILQITSIMLL